MGTRAHPVVPLRIRFVVHAIPACFNDEALLVDDARRQGFEESLAEARRLAIVPGEDEFY